MSLMISASGRLRRLARSDFSGNCRSKKRRLPVRVSSSTVDRIWLSASASCSDPARLTIRCAVVEPCPETRALGVRIDAVVGSGVERRFFRHVAIARDENNMRRGAGVQLPHATNQCEVIGKQHRMHFRCRAVRAPLRSQRTSSRAISAVFRHLRYLVRTLRSAMQTSAAGLGGVRRRTLASVERS